MLGLGFYGRSFTLSDLSCTVPGRPVAGRVDLGECTASTGILSNYEIDRIITERYKPNVVYNETALTTNMHDTVNGRPETAAFDKVHKSPIPQNLSISWCAPSPAALFDFYRI